jgi:hypothetical protein
VGPVAVSAGTDAACSNDKLGDYRQVHPLAPADFGAVKLAAGREEGNGVLAPKPIPGALIRAVQAVHRMLQVVPQLLRLALSTSPR